ncbi:hypothetical protein D3C86_1989360 [compost metagenome]
MPLHLSQIRIEQLRTLLIELLSHLLHQKSRNQMRLQLDRHVEACDGRKARFGEMLIIHSNELHIFGNADPSLMTLGNEFQR